MMPPAIDEQQTAPTPNYSTRDSSEVRLWWVIGALTALYVIVVAIGNRRYVWFDELFTFDFARSESLGQLWYRVQRFDCNPPTVYLLSRISMSIFGPSAFGLRFPSMVEFYFGSVAVLLYVRRKASLAFGVVAVLMLWAVAPGLYYAVEARPYALLFLSFACLLLSWDSAIKGPPRGWAFFGISASTLALALAHVFAPFTLFAFVIAEIVRFRRRRVPDYPLWAALFLPMLSMLLYIPLIRSYGGIVFPAVASYNTIVVFFQETFGASIMGFVLLAALFVPLHEIPEEPLPRFSAEELALIGCMALGPILLNLVLMHRHGMFYNRYGITAQVAILAALAIFIAYRLRLNRFAAYAAATVLVLAILKLQVWHPLLYPEAAKTGALMSVRPDLPIVVGEGQVFMEMNSREDQLLLDRLYFLKDHQASLQYSRSNYFQDFEAPDVLQRAGFPFTAKVAPYAGFVREHQQFLLLGSPREWVFQKLLANGASIAFFADYSGAMPYMDRTLYLVRMPATDAPKQ